MKATLIIINYNGRHLLAQCIARHLVAGADEAQPDDPRTISRNSHGLHYSGGAPGASRVGERLEPGSCGCAAARLP